MLKFLRNCQVVLQSNCTKFTFSPTWHEGLNFSLLWPPTKESHIRFLIWYFHFKFDHSDNHFALSFFFILYFLKQRHKNVFSSLWHWDDTPIVSYLIYSSQGEMTEAIKYLKQVVKILRNNFQFLDAVKASTMLGDIYNEKVSMCVSCFEGEKVQNVSVLFLLDPHLPTINRSTWLMHKAIPGKRNASFFLFCQHLSAILGTATTSC